MDGFHPKLHNFSQKNNKLAFEESLRAMASLFDGEWHGKHGIVVESALHLTTGVSPATWHSVRGDSDRPL